MMAQRIPKLSSLLVAVVLIIGSSHGDSNENLKKLAIANNDLGLKLYKILVKDASENVFFSPFSLSNAFGILFAGSKGNTAEQLRSVLGYDSAKLKNCNVPSAFDQYLDTILPKNQSPNPEYILNLANELLLAEDFNVYPKYKNQVRNLFHAYIEEVDFEKNSAQIVQEVNNWVSEQTHGKISQLLSDLNPSTVLLILNAIYFKGTWKTQFDTELTQPGNFYNDGSNSEAKEVPLMHLTTKFPYASVDDLQALELPYKGENISMIVLLPNERDGLTCLENSITPQKIRDIQNQMYTTEVIVTLPKFKIEYGRTLNLDFEALGATDMFNPGTADFSGITPNKGVYVNQVVHKAAVEVNEEGSEAAAATGISGIAAVAAEPPELTADHPFMFAIMDNRNDLILFVGRVTKLEK